MTTFIIENWYWIAGYVWIGIFVSNYGNVFSQAVEGRSQGIPAHIVVALIWPVILPIYLSAILAGFTMRWLIHVK